MTFTPLSDLPLGRAHCGVCVRVVRLWDYCGNKESDLPLHVDMVLVDEQENRMYAEIPGAEAEKFKTQICEGGVYVFRKFIVSSSKSAYKPFQGSQMIKFTPWTSVEQKFRMQDKLPKYVFDLVAFPEFSSRVGQVDCFIDAIGIIAGVSEVAYVHLPSSQSSTAKRVVSLRDQRNNQINLVLWGNRATEFDAENVHAVGQESPVVAIFVGETTLSGGAACKWYINEDIPEIDEVFSRMSSDYIKVEWISAGDQQFRTLEHQKILEEKTVLQLRDMDPWEFEGSGFRCTVTVSRININQPWWFSSCTKCHRASVPSGTYYKCSGGCPCTTAEPKYRLSVVATDGTATAEFTLFGRVARQVIGKPVVALIRSASKNQHGAPGTESERMLPELAALVSHKFTFVVAISQKNLTQRNASFQVNSVVTFYGKQTHIPYPPPTSYDHGKETLATLPALALGSEILDGSMRSKKARLDKKTIPSKKALDFGDSSNGKAGNISDKDTQVGDATTDTHLVVGGAMDSEMRASEVLANNPPATSADISVAAKTSESPQHNSKSRPATNRKRSAA